MAEVIYYDDITSFSLDGGESFETMETSDDTNSLVVNGYDGYDGYDVYDVYDDKLVTIDDISSKFYPLINTFSNTSVDFGISESLIVSHVYQQIYGYDKEIPSSNKVIKSEGWNIEHGMTSNVVDDLIRNYILDFGNITTEDFYINNDLPLAVIKPNIEVNKCIVRKEITWGDLSCGICDLNCIVNFQPYKPAALSSIGIKIDSNGIDNNIVNIQKPVEDERIEGDIEIYKNQLFLIGKPSDNISVSFEIPNVVNLQEVETKILENDNVISYSNIGLINRSFIDMDKNRYSVKKTITLNPMDKVASLPTNTSNITIGNVILPSDFITWGTRVSIMNNDIDRILITEDDAYEGSKDSNIYNIENIESTTNYKIVLPYNSLSYHINANDSSVPLDIYLPVSSSTLEYGEDIILFYLRCFPNLRSMDWYSKDEIGLNVHYQPKAFSYITVYFINETGNSEANSEARANVDNVSGYCPAVNEISDNSKQSRYMNWRWAYGVSTYGGTKEVRFEFYDLNEILVGEQTLRGNEGVSSIVTINESRIVKYVKVIFTDVDS